MISALKTKKGFTLIELLVVTAILGTMSTFVVINFRGASNRAEDTKRRSELQQYQNLLEIYASNNNNSFLTYNGSISSQCSTINPSSVNSCANDPDPSKNYLYNGNATQYVLWTELDIEEAGATNYFVICSNGQTGETTTVPNSSNCPL